MSRRILLKSMATALLLSDLPADIIFSIFACCDIASVVSVAQTCRCLHALAFERSVWLDLLGDLRRRCILDRNCTPSLETLSTAEMIEVVKRLMTGPQSWSPRELHCDSVAEVSRKITLHPTATHSLRWSDVILLPSGRYLFLLHMNKLECWSIANNCVVWTYTSSMEKIGVQEFAAQENDADVTIMLSLETYLNSNPGPKCIEMVKLDFRTMTHTSLLIALVPGHTNTFSGLLICGALAMASLNMDTGESLYMILNWKQKSYCILQGTDWDASSGPHAVLLPGHILISERDWLSLISSDTLGNYWAQIIGTGDPAHFSIVSVKDIPKVTTFEPVIDIEQSFDEIYVHENPIRSRDFSVWIYGASHIADRGALLSYRLSIPAGGDPQWCLRIQSVMAPNQALESFYQGATYCGHRLYAPIRDPELTIFSATSPVTSPRMVLELPPDVGDRIDIATYSGALTYFTDSSIVIEYYR
ncbi:hypothetical protein C8R45DRAFT_1102144 [Mycena sanguinolenta]|nr:hypothetical protein C8R45DRAFT_1102144 [Mycena sanguinolenta]